MKYVFGGMDSGRPDTARRHCACSCFDCLVPVRCIIDQHEVEIIPASARSTNSNEYSARGGSGADSASRAAYGSSSYRQQQLQQLSQRAAAVDLTPRQGRGGLFAPSMQPPEQQPASYRSAAAASDIFCQSRQGSWDTKAPRVPLINLRKMQEHGATLPPSPADSERLLAAAVRTPQTSVEDSEKSKVKGNNDNADPHKKVHFSLPEERQRRLFAASSGHCGDMKETEKREDAFFFGDDCFKGITPPSKLHIKVRPGASLFNDGGGEAAAEGQHAESARSGFCGVYTDFDSFPLLGMEYSLCTENQTGKYEIKNQKCNTQDAEDAPDTENNNAGPSLPSAVYVQKHHLGKNVHVLRLDTFLKEFPVNNSSKREGANNT